MDLAKIRQRIDAGADSDRIRADLAQKIMQCLLAQGAELGPWERVHFGIAIDLLPSPWLQLTWTHVDSVCNRSAFDPTRSLPTVVSHPPTVEELIEKLKAAQHEIRLHQLLMLKQADE